MTHAEIHIGGTARSPEDAERLYQLGLQFAEIPVANPGKFSSLVDPYRAVKEKLGLYYLCHGPREGDPNDIQALQGVYFPKIAAMLPTMKRLDMSLLTIHLWLDRRFVKENVIPFKIGLLKKIVESGENEEIMICLENLSERAEDMERPFEEIPQLSMTLDLGHAQLLTAENRSYEFIRSFPDRIKHVHMHDNRGGRSHRDDIHLPPGQGIVDFKEIVEGLKKVGYARTITLELTPDEIRACLPYVRDLVE
ncbi:MAG: sugar phosphate isomerase/epimerase [Deltaproteobacteria bacterium]